MVSLREMTTIYAAPISLSEIFASNDKTIKFAGIIFLSIVVWLHEFIKHFSNWFVVVILQWFFFDLIHGNSIGNNRILQFRKTQDIIYDFTNLLLVYFLVCNLTFKNVSGLQINSRNSLNSFILGT